MGTVTKTKLVDGTIKYRAQVRVKKEGQPKFVASKTFSKKSLADEWIKKVEYELEKDPEKYINKKSQGDDKTLRDLILSYLDEVDAFGDTKQHALKFILNFPIANKSLEQLNREDFKNFALTRKNGDPILNIMAVTPSTILKDLSHIKSVLVHTNNLSNQDALDGVLTEFEKALDGLRRARIVTKSKTRERLPTNEELQALTNYFYKSWVRVKRSTPMHLIMWFAIYTARREDEICSLQLSDFDEYNSQWLIRDVKNPEGSTGNHKYAHLEPRALELIKEFKKPDIRKRMLELGYNSKLLIPVNTRSVSAFFTRACQACGIEDLKFHDLRHEAASRYAEQGMTIPQLQTITLHESWGSLKRYVNLKKRKEVLEFDEALRTAQEAYNSHYKEWVKKQRYVASIDKIIDIAPKAESIKVDLPIIKKLLKTFIQLHKNNKYFKRMHVKKMDSENPFAWNNSEKSFYALDIQLAWQDWLKNNCAITHADLPNGATHFSVKDLSALKCIDKKVYIWESQFWIDTMGEYTIIDNDLIDIQQA